MTKQHDMNRQWKELEQRSQFASTFVITTHQNPDADGLGSELALYHLLKKLGKDQSIIYDVKYAFPADATDERL